MKANFLPALVLSLALLGANYNPAHGEHNQNSMTMHHMHMMINHAMEMAVEGSNLIMVGQMKMAPGVDEGTIKHGRHMIDMAKDMLKEVLNSDAMKKLHEAGTTPEKDQAMAFTHKLAEQASGYISLIDKMDAAPAHHH